MVPIFILLLPSFGVASAILPQVAVASALAATVPAAASAVVAQHRRGALQVSWLKILVPSAALGAVGGSMVASSVPGGFIAAIFAAYAGYFGLRMVADANAPSGDAAPTGRPRGIIGVVPRWLVGGAIGFFSSTAGVGGASLTVPYLLRCERTLGIKHAVALASAVGLSIAIAGTISFALSSPVAAAGTQGLVGLVCWPAGLAVGAAAALSAPWGVTVSHRLPVRQLKRVFGALMIVAGLITVVKVFG